MISNYFLVGGIRPVEVFDTDNIDFVKSFYNTDNVIRLTYKQFKTIELFYSNYIQKICDTLNNGKEK